MRVMVLVKASPESDVGPQPGARLLADMGRFNEELVNAGVLLAADGLRPSSDGVRVRFDGRVRTILSGPFAESTDLIAGYWIWQVRSLDEAVEWLKRAPFDDGEEVEIRPVTEPDDFGAEFTPEIRAQEAGAARKAATLEGGTR